MIGLIIYIIVLIIVVVFLMKWNINSLEKIEELKKSNKELLESNYKLTNKKNGK